MTPQPSVLIVEDDTLTALTLYDVIEFWGYKVCPVAGTPETALQNVREYQPDVVMLDMHLPGDMDSLELARKVQACSGAAIVFMTGDSENALKKRALRLNPLAYMLKPLQLNELRGILQEAYPSSIEI
jgi:DNA-binding NarL/FixJ family response regulator